MGFWGNFNRMGKSLPNMKDVIKVPSEVRNQATNVSLNKIAVRYWEMDFADCHDTIGEIMRFGSTSLVLFQIPDCKGAILLLNKTTYINRSRNNERCIEVCANYPFSLDRNSDIIKFADVHYQDIKNNIKVSDSQEAYYTNVKEAIKGRKLFVPRMMNETVIPIIRLDDADRLTPIDKKYTKMAANITQTFLREWIDVKLLQRTGSKNTSGMVFVAGLFLAVGTIFGLILSAFIK
jgi:hypothetical protein